jgi:hypothetical protein
MVGIGGFEPPTSRLSGVRSNHLSYTPTHMRRNNGCSLKTNQRGGLPCFARAALLGLPYRLEPSQGYRPGVLASGFRRAPALLRKEVIQPHLPIRLPCYDFTPIICPTFDGSLPCGLGHRLRVLQTFVV